MTFHEPKDPLVLPHRIFLGRKFDLQVNGVLKYETKLPLSLNYSEVFLEEIITGPKYFGPENVDQKPKQPGSNKTNPALSNCIEFGLPIESGACQK